MLARLVLTSCLILPGFSQVPKPLLHGRYGEEASFAENASLDHRYDVAL